MADDAAPQETAPAASISGADSTTAAVQGADATTASVGVASLAENPRENPNEDWSPPPTRDDGVALDGHELPVNLRLRALELARSGKDDPTGRASPELIADAAERIKAYESEFPPLTGLTKDQLAERAAKEGVVVPDGATKDDISAAITAARPALA